MGASNKHPGLRLKDALTKDAHTKIDQHIKTLIKAR